MNQKIVKILILANNSIGLYNFRLELIEKLLEIGYEVYFSVPENSEDKKVKHLVGMGAKYINTPINRRGMNPIEEFKLVRRYISIVNDIRPNVILTYTIKPNIYGNYVASKFKIPTITNITGIGSSLSTGRFKIVIKRMYEYACNQATIVFFQNSENLNFFKKNNLINEEKAKLISGSGVNTIKFSPMEKKIKDDKIRFLFIGRLMKDKGVDEYLKVARSFANRYTNVEFQILGPFEEDRYKDLIMNYNKKNIKYLGVSNDVRNEIRNADCIVNPSYHEGMSNVLLEGASMGKPLLASNIPGCKEIIDDGVNGYLFNPRSNESLEKAIISFISLNIEERKRLGQQSRIKVLKEFDRVSVINEYIKEIKNTLGQEISNGMHI